MNNQPTSFSIVGLKCFDLVTEVDPPRYLGGIERMLVSFGHALTQQKHRVSFITYKPANEPRREFAYNDFTVRTTFYPNEGIPVIRAFYPRFISVLQQMRRSESDCFIQMGAGIETFFTAIASKLIGKPFVYLIASDSDCVHEMPLVTSNAEKVLYKLGLKLANLIIAQTKEQQKLLESNFGLASEVMNLPHVGNLGTSQDKTTGISMDVLWVGRLVEGKRPELLLDVAERLKDVRFHLVGAANQDSEFSRAVLKRANDLPNVTAHGKVGELELTNLYQTCSLLCCTSELEGFPATFLEAWSKPMPVVTTFDPDKVVETNHLGYFSRNADELESHLLQVLQSEPEQYRQLIKRCNSFYKTNYSSSAIIPNFVDRVMRG